MLAYMLLLAVALPLTQIFHTPEVEVILAILSVALLVVLPIFVTGIFTYGFDIVDVSARTSCFPAHFFRLPVGTATLVLWPMLYGAAVVMLLWLALIGYILIYLLLTNPAGRFLPEPFPPLWWPGVMAVAFLAWIQAILWAPYGLPWLRIVLLALVLIALPWLTGRAVLADTAELSLVLTLGGIAAAGWAVAYLGVRQARYGAGPDWAWIFKPLRQLSRRLPRRLTPFASARQAQDWYEWQLDRAPLPFMVAFGLASILILFPLMTQGKFLPDAFAVESSLAWSLAMPVVFAGVGNGWLGSGRSRGAKNKSGLMPFIATLPVRTSDMAGAVLKASVWSTLAAWGVVMVTVPSVFFLAGHFQRTLEMCRRELLATGTPIDGVVRMLAIAAFLLVWTWKRKVYRLCLSLTGSQAIEQAFGWGRLPGYLILILIALSVAQFSFRLLEAALPWVIALFLLGRLAAAVWALELTRRRRLVREETLACWLCGWLMAASALFALGACAMPRERTPSHYIVAAALFVMPTGRLAAMPLVLALNRHR
jgi:hypothetical protein